MENRAAYIKVCEEQQLPIFSQYWWLDAVCGEKNWLPLVVQKDGRILATLPVYMKKKFPFFSIITMPKYTPMLCPFIFLPENSSPTKRISMEMAALNTLIEQFPKHDYYLQQFHYNIKNWLPFMWAGFKQSTYYSYVIEDISEIENVFQNFDSDKRNQIRKAEKILELSEEISANEFYEFHKNCLAKKGEKISYSFEFFTKLYRACVARNAVKLLKAQSKDGRIESAICIVYDNKSAYSLITAVDPDFPDHHAMAFLFYKSIAYFSQKVQCFDFEGSCIKGVEKSYRSYGGTQKPYFIIRKNNSKLLKLVSLFKSDL